MFLATGLFLLLLSPVMAMAAATEVPVLTPDELRHYQFDTPVEAPAAVADLNTGEQAILDSQRQVIEDLLVRRLGILSLRHDRRDLALIQKLVDQQVIDPGNTRQWQALGVIFGDILVSEFHLHWVSYEDDLGRSRALRWKQTENYVFPVTVFSRRIQFRQKIDAQRIFDVIEQTIESFRQKPAPGSPPGSGTG